MLKLKNQRRIDKSVDESCHRILRIVSRWFVNLTDNEIEIRRYFDRILFALISSTQNSFLVSFRSSAHRREEETTPNAMVSKCRVDFSLELKISESWFLVSWHRFIRAFVFLSKKNSSRFCLSKLNLKNNKNLEIWSIVVDRNLSRERKRKHRRKLKAKWKLSKENKS